MTVVQAAGLGGGSLIYANVQMRAPAAVFERGWPRGYSRAALDPYYDLVAYMLDINPITKISPAIGAALKNVRYNCPEPWPPHESALIELIPDQQAAYYLFVKQTAAIADETANASQATQTGSASRRAKDVR